MFSKLTGSSIRAPYRFPIAHLAGFLSVLALSYGTALAATTDDELFAVAANLLDSPCTELCERENFSVTPLGSRRVAVMSGERFKSSEADLYLIRSNDANCQGEAPECEAAIVVSDGRIWRFLASSGEGYDYLTQVRMIETGRFRELTEPETSVVTQDAATGSVQADKLCEARGMSPLADQINEFLAAGPARLSDANGEEVAEIKDRVVAWPGGQANGPITEVRAGLICLGGPSESGSCLRVYRCHSGEASFVLADETGDDVALLQLSEQSEQSETAQGTPVAVDYAPSEVVHKIRGFTNQGIVFTLSVGTRRGEGGVLVRLLDAEAGYNAAANFNAVAAQEAFDMGLHVVTRKDCKNCRPGFVGQSSTAWRFADGVLRETAPPSDVFVPDQALTDADIMNFSFLARNDDGGILFLSPDGIPTNDLLGSSSGEAQSVIAPSGGALSQGAAAIARGLLADYGNDMERITKVADHADMALLAWAAYGEPEALAAARDRGWTSMESIVNENIIAGDTVAMRFAAEDGRQVLAFRGTLTGGDWYTDTAGTVVPSPLTTGQIRGGVEIALQMKHQYPDIVFVGHSLGGRLAQIARLRTGNKAIVFNSAPLNISEFKDEVEQRLFDALTGIPGPKEDILFFRNQGDALTRYSIRDQIDVSNVLTVEGVEGFARLNVRLLATYIGVNHSMGMLAGAMQQVRIARDEGWLAAYLREQDSTGEISTQPDELAWLATMTPHFRLAPGQSRDGLVVGTDGSLTVAGTVVFPAAEVPTKAEIHVYQSPVSGHRAVIQRNLDRSGLRAAVLSDEGAPGFIVSVVPEDMVAGYGRERAAYHVLDGAAWSPDGAFLAFQLAIEGQVSLLLVELSTGGATLAHPDEGGDDAAVAIDELRYDEEFGGGDQLKAPFRKYRCVGDGCSQREITSEVSITFDVAGAIANNPWPTIRAGEVSQPQDQEWGPEIVAPEDFDPTQNACDAMENAACLRTAGFSEPAIDFIEALGEAGGIGRSFQELGRVDLVELDLSHSPWRSYLFVNGVPSELFVTVPDPALPGSYHDGASKRLLAGIDPMGGDWANVEVVSHRRMPSEGQRFVATSLVTSGCRACPIVGIAVRQFDFDAKGKLVAETMIGLMDWRGRDLTRQYEGAAVLRDTALAQFLLNIRGYDAGPMDGDFGARSRVALGAFQSEHCLPKTGVLDAASAEALAKNDFFSYACEGNDISEGLVAAETAPEADQATQPEEGASCTTIENDTARLECYDSASGVAPDEQRPGGPLSREEAASLIATSEAARERRSNVYMTSRAWSEALQQDIFRPNGSWELFPSPAIRAEVAGGLPGGKLLELTPEATSRVSLIVEVTGITLIGETGARVEFVWRYHGLPAWIAEGSRPAAASRADLRLYDDGWRVVEADFPIGEDECTAEQNARNSEGWAAFLGGGC